MKPCQACISDETILSGCIKGDRDFQEAFVMRFSNLVYDRIHRTLKKVNTQINQQHIEDLHQTVFLKLFDQKCRKLKQYKGKNGCSLGSWICVVTMRIVLDYLSRGTDALAHRHPSETLDLAVELHAPGPLPSDQLTTAEHWRQIEMGLKQLKMRDQLVIRMHYCDGYPMKNIGKALGISKENIHSVKHRALKRLRSKIKKLQ